MKKLIVSLAATTALFAAAPAFAQDNGNHNWSGWYAGAFVNHSWGSPDMHPIHNNPTIDDDGFVAGLLGGYRVQQPNDVVYGVQLSVPVIAEKGNSIGGPAVFDTIEMKFAAIVTGQVGRAYGYWLPMVSFGGGFVSVESTNVAGSQTVTHPALTVGLGINRAINEYVAVGARYNYTKVFKKTHATPFNLGTDNRFGADVHSVGAVVEFMIPIGN